MAVIKEHWHEVEADDLGDAPVITAGGDAAVASHAAAENPHPTYTTAAELSAAVDAAINALIAGAPGALNTLDELAAAVNDDASFASAVTTALAGKLAASAMSAFGLTLVDDTNAAAARATLGIPALVAASVTDTTTGSFQTSSGTFAAVHASFNLALTTGARRVRVTVAGGCSAVGSLDLYVDGVSVSGDKGLIINASAAVAGDQNASFSFLTPVLSAGAHTFELRFMGTTFVLYAGGASGGPALHMSVEETAIAA